MFVRSVQRCTLHLLRPLIYTDDTDRGYEIDQVVLIAYAASCSFSNRPPIVGGVERLRCLPLPR